MGKYYYHWIFRVIAISLAEQVKQRKLRAIGTRTQLQAIERQNMSKKVFCNLRLCDFIDLLRINSYKESKRVKLCWRGYGRNTRPWSESSKISRPFYNRWTLRIGIIRFRSFIKSEIRLNPIKSGLFTNVSQFCAHPLTAPYSALFRSRFFQLQPKTWPYIYIYNKV